MSIRTKRLISALLAALLLAAIPALAVTPQDYDRSQPEALQADHLYCEAAILIDETTGEVLFEKNSGVRMYPASTTKIMTLLLALESNISLDEQVTIPAEAGDVPEGSSVIPVEPGDVMSFRDLLCGFMLSSGNDGANAVAVLVDGSIDKFVKRMNQRAAALGCKGTHFVNAHGYHTSKHYSTAQDLAIMARAAMRNADFRDIVAAPSWRMTISRGGKTVNTDVVSRNSLLISGQKYYYPECTGIKTGHHRKAGWCFVGSAEREGRRVICVVLNCENEDDKWYDAAKLFEYGFTRYEPVSVTELLQRRAVELDPVAISGAATDDPQGGALVVRLEPLSGESVSLMLPRDSATAQSTALDELARTAEVNWERELVAPVAEGERLGTITCTTPDGQKVSVSIVASRSIAAYVEPTAAPTATPTAAPTAMPVDSPLPTTPPAGKANAAPERRGIHSGVWIALAAILLAAALAGSIRARRARKRREAARRRARRGRAAGTRHVNRTVNRR